MPRTPDSAPGVSQEEGIDWEALGPATLAGQMRWDGSKFSFYDGSGEYDPRVGGLGFDIDKVMVFGNGASVTFESNGNLITRG